MRAPDMTNFPNGFKPKAVTDYYVAFTRDITNEKTGENIASEMTLVMGIREDDMNEARRLFDVICECDYRGWAVIDAAKDVDVVHFEDDRNA